MRSKNLTAIAARTAPIGWHCDGHGLYLQCTAAADEAINRSWVYRYSANGRERYMGLGPLADVSLAEAREKAAAVRKLRLEGIDPLEHKRAQRTATRLEAAKRVVFKQCVDTFLEFKQHEWSNPKHAAQWEMTLRKYAAPLHNISPTEIDLAIVAKTLEPIWTEIPETASRTRQRIEAVLDHWAAKNEIHDYRNPATWERLKHVLPSVAKLKGDKHHPALPFDQLPEFMTELRQRDESIAAQALEFAILTATRTGDIIGNEREEKPPMRWPHVDLDQRIWTIPSTKTEIELRVPLSDQAVKLLNGLSRSGNVVFAIDGEPLSNMGMSGVIKRMNQRRTKLGLPRYVDPKEDNRDITVHGFRSTFRDWAAERTNYPNHVVEMALAHKVGDKVEAAYRRGDLFTKRTKLMTAWAQYCEKAPIAPTVLQFKGATR